MVRVITQETFDEVVKENVEEFDMSPEEAIKDAVEQFEAQGVDLSNIVKDLAMNELQNAEQQSLLRVITNIRDLLRKEVPSPELAQQFTSLSNECDKSLAHKILAAKNGAYALTLTVLEKFNTDIDIVSPALNAITSLMAGQPDLLDERGIKLMIDYLDTQSSMAVQAQVLEWGKQCCLKHEKNRQDIFKANLLGRLKKLLENEKTSSPVIRHTCALIRALVLDDDVRVEYGNAHEHARMMAKEVLCTLTDLLKKFRGDAGTASDLILTLATLVVRKEFCDKVEEAGGVIFLTDVFVNYSKNERLIRLSLKLLKALCGSDEVKDKIIKAGTAPLITNAMYMHRKSAALTAAGCACIGALSLRSPENSKVLCAAGAAEVVIEGMKAHPDDADVQRQGSTAIRNIVSRSRNLCHGFLELGGEDVLNSALIKHKAKCEFEVKGALRDLGCNVKLKESWSGKGGALK